MVYLGVIGAQTHVRMGGARARRTNMTLCAKHVVVVKVPRKTSQRTSSILDRHPCKRWACLSSPTRGVESNHRRLSLCQGTSSIRDRRPCKRWATLVVPKLEVKKQPPRLPRAPLPPRTKHESTRQINAQMKNKKQDPLPPPSYIQISGYENIPEIDRTSHITTRNMREGKRDMTEVTWQIPQNIVGIHYWRLLNTWLKT